MKKILFIGNTAWSMYNFRRPIFQHFLRKGKEVVVIAPHDNLYIEKLKEIGCKCYTVDIDAKGKNPFKDIVTMYNFKQIIKREKPNICFFYTIKPNIYGSIVATQLKIPFIPITTGLGYTFLKDNLINKFTKKMYQVAFTKANKVWFLNKDDANSFVNAQIIPTEKVCILKGEGIDTNKFEVQPLPKEISFLFIARMLWDKGVGEFVDAARILKKKYPKVNFKLLGFLGVDNPSAVSKKQMDEWVNEGIVEYLGATNDVRPYIYQSTCVVLPSFYREGIPFSLMEGAAAGRPIIGSNNVGCKEVVDHGENGFLCKIKDSQDLSNQMEKIILMPNDERTNMGIKGRKKIENEFSIKLVIDKYEQTLNSIK